MGNCSVECLDLYLDMKNKIHLNSSERVSRNFVKCGKYMACGIYEFCTFLLKVLQIFAPSTNIYKIRQFHEVIFSMFYFMLDRLIKFAYFVMLFLLIVIEFLVHV